MKRTVILLAATLIAGLLVYGALELTGMIGVTPQGLVLIPAGAFVLVLVSCGMLAGLLAIKLDGMFARERTRELRELEERVAGLERRGEGEGSSPGDGDS